MDPISAALPQNLRRFFVATMPGAFSGFASVCDEDDDDKDDDDKKPSNREDVKESGFVDPASSH